MLGAGALGHLALGAQAAAPTPPAETWNPYDKSASYTLSGGNLTATLTVADGSNWSTVRGTVPTGSNLVYAEYTFAVGSPVVGIINATAALGPSGLGWVGSGFDGCGFAGDGGVYI